MKKKLLLTLSGAALLSVGAAVAAHFVQSKKGLKVKRSKLSSSAIPIDADFSAFTNFSENVNDLGNFSIPLCNAVKSVISVISAETATDPEEWCVDTVDYDDLSTCTLYTWERPDLIVDVELNLFDDSVEYTRYKVESKQCKVGCK